MKRGIWNYINSTPLNPILLIVIFTIIGYLALVLLKEMEYFFSCVGIGISAAVVQCTMIQNRIQKDNIKIQLFDKRNMAFQNVLDSVTIIKRDNWDRFILFNDSNINRQILQIEKDLYKSEQLSKYIFDKDVYMKFIKVNNAFCRVAKSYKNMLTTNQNIKTQNNAQEYIELFYSFILSRTESGEKELINKFPKAYFNLMDFSRECDAYLSLVEECGIINDFGKYIIVDK